MSWSLNFRFFHRLFVGYLLFLPLVCSAVSTDSLLYLVNTYPKDDSLKASYYNDLVMRFCYSNTDTALFFVEHGLALSSKIGETGLLAQAYLRKGIVHDIRNEWEVALSCYDSALAIAQKDQNTKAIGSAYNNKGLIYWNQGNYFEASTFFEKAIVIFEQLGNDKGRANAMNNIAVILQEQKRYDESLEQHYKVLQEYRRQDNEYGVSASYSNLALVYELTKQFDSAKKYLQLAIPIKIRLNDRHGLAINYTNLSEVFEREGWPDSSMKYTQIAIQIHRELGNNRLLANNLSSLGTLYQENGDLQSAQKALEEALLIAEKTNIPKVKFGIYQRLAYVSEARGDFESAYHYMVQRMRLYAELYEVEKEEKIAEVMEKYNSEKKEKELFIQKSRLKEEEARTRRKNVQLFIISVVLLVLAAISVYVYHTEKQKRVEVERRNRLEKELAQKHTHNEIQKERLRISRDLHDNIGAQLSYIISSMELAERQSSSGDVKSRLSDTRDFTKRTIQEFRDSIWAMKGGSISFVDWTDRLIDHVKSLQDAWPNTQIRTQVGLTEFPPFNGRHALHLLRIIQEGLNNSLKHGKPSRIDLTIQENSGELVVCIEDDGIGFDLNKTEKGNGLVNFQHRSSMLGGQLLLESTPGTGTRLTLSIPVDQLSVKERG
ncbi:MAG: sensor histidine kinase [Bacteroidia bacterium]|nr:sensor histidine kinase [Bacteroidia bacterium]